MEQAEASSTLLQEDWRVDDEGTWCEDDPSSTEYPQDSHTGAPGAKSSAIAQASALLS